MLRFICKASNIRLKRPFRNKIRVRYGPQKLTTGVLKSTDVIHWIHEPTKGMFLKSSVATAPGCTALTTRFRSLVRTANSRTNRRLHSLVVP